MRNVRQEIRLSFRLNDGRFETEPSQDVSAYHADSARPSRLGSFLSYQSQSENCTVLEIQAHRCCGGIPRKTNAV